ncbi:MAG: hypothetical protein RL343_718 [Actinomycetota bacterium]
MSTPNTQSADQAPDPADSAAKHRAKQTVVNLVLSLVACLGIVIITVLAVPRDDSNRIKAVDYVSAAESAEASSNLNLVAPELPKGWWANQAKWNESAADGVKVWKVGFVGPNNQYVGVTQGFGVNPTWVALQTVGFEPDTQSTAKNNTWTKWKPGKNTDADPHLWTLEKNGNFIAMSSTATDAELDEFAALLEKEIK